MLCSSHYSQLKVFAYNTAGVENASVEFDVQTLAPTYRLVIGLPGRSNAIAIAARLGLAEELVARARGRLSAEDASVEEMLARLKEAVDRTEEARHEAEGTLARTRAMETELRRKLASIESARRQVVEEARQEGREELTLLREEIRRLRQSIRSGRAPTRATPVDQITSIDKALEAADTLEQALAPLPSDVEETPRPVGSLRAGDRVHVRTLDKQGEILAVDDEEAEIAVGGFRLRTPTDTLELRSRPEPREREPSTEVTRPQRASPGTETDLRGLRAEEIAPVLGQYLDSAYLAGLPWVRVIHGKGTGVLKSVVRDYVTGHPLVRSHRRGGLGEGGDGVTVVELRKAE
jgi:DNA mismatch repair protein MutS2